MLRLEAYSSVLEEAVGSRLIEGKREATELSVSDFDATRFKVTVLPKSEHVVRIDVDVPCWKELEQLGVGSMLEASYGSIYHPSRTPEPGYCCVFELDCNAQHEHKSALLEKLIFLKRNTLGAPFRRALEHLANKETTPSFCLPWRPGEAIYCVQGEDPANPAHKDRVVVVYAISFGDEADAAICRIILQQFQEVQRKLGQAPPCSFNEANKPPREILALTPTPSPPSVGYISFAIFKRHVDTPTKLNKAVELIVGLRNYLMYHIKAAKTNQHMRMRKKVFDWLQVPFCSASLSEYNSFTQVINRAHHTNAKAPEHKQMKTHSGRTFVRKA